MAVLKEKLTEETLHAPLPTENHQQFRPGEIPETDSALPEFFVWPPVLQDALNVALH